MPRIFFIIISILSLLAASSAQADSDVPYEAFVIGKMKLKCAENAMSNAETRGCIVKASTELAKKYSGGVACAKLTCVVKLPCVKSHCEADSYSVTYEPSQVGRDIHIVLASGKKIEYGQCGTCNGIDPSTESEVTIELLPGTGVVFLEFPKQYR